MKRNYNLKVPPQGVNGRNSDNSKIKQAQHPSTPGPGGDVCLDRTAVSGPESRQAHGDLKYMLVMMNFSSRSLWDSVAEWAISVTRSLSCSLGSAARDRSLRFCCIARVWQTELDFLICSAGVSIMHLSRRKITTKVNLTARQSTCDKKQNLEGRLFGSS